MHSRQRRAFGAGARNGIGRGSDPYDALSSPWAGAVTLRTALGRRILTQAVKRSSVNLRPALRIPKSRNHKAIGLVASAYSYLGAAGDDAARSGAGRWLDWLEREHVGGSDGLAWAYHFDVQTRFFSYPANSPNTIATTFVALAFLDAVEQLDDGHASKPRFGLPSSSSPACSSTDPRPVLHLRAR